DAVRWVRVVQRLTLAQVSRLTFTTAPRTYNYHLDDASLRSSCHDDSEDRQDRQAQETGPFVTAHAVEDGLRARSRTWDSGETPGCCDRVKEVCPANRPEPQSSRAEIVPGTVLRRVSAGSGRDTGAPRRPSAALSMP